MMNNQPCSCSKREKKQNRDHLELYPMHNYNATSNIAKKNKRKNDDRLGRDM